MLNKFFWCSKSVSVPAGRWYELLGRWMTADGFALDLDPVIRGCRLIRPRADIVATLPVFEFPIKPFLPPVFSCGTFSPDKAAAAPPQSPSWCTNGIYQAAVRTAQQTCLWFLPDRRVNLRDPTLRVLLQNKVRLLPYFINW